jgi:PAS domain S-box-containing protein
MKNISLYSGSIRSRLMLFFLFFAVTITTSHFLTRASYQSLDKYQVILNLIAENNDLIDEVALYTQEILANNSNHKNLLSSTIHKFEKNIASLQGLEEVLIGNTQTKLPAPEENSQAHKVLKELHDLWYEEYGKNAQYKIFLENTFLDSLLLNGKKVVKPEVQKAADEIYTIRPLLIKKNEALRDEYIHISSQEEANVNTWLWVLWGINLALIGTGLVLIQTWVLSPLKQISNVAEMIGKGDLTHKVDYEQKNEVGFVADAINGMLDKIKNATDFIKSIEQGDLNVSYTGVNGVSVEKDTLAGALIDMREKMKSVATEEYERKWSTQGLALFGEILQTYNDDTERLSYEIVSNVVKYLDANQGALFLVSDDEDEEICLDLIACYAYQRRRFLKKRVGISEGLVGQSFKDADTIYITDIPDNYVDITSGIGGSQPKSVLVLPLKLSDRVYGVIELASFKDIKSFQIAFLERVSENIASNLYAARANERTKRLLLESNKITEQMRFQELEMRKNLDVLELTQYEMQRNQEALAAQSYAIKSTLISVELSTNGTILSCNDLFLKAMKYSQEEVIGKNHAEFVTNNQLDLANYEKVWRDLKAGLPHSGEFKRTDKYGNDVWLRATYSPIKDRSGKPYKILKLAFDITEDKKLRLEFKEQLDSFKRSSAIVEFDMQGKIIEVNDNFVDLMEYSRDEIMGQDHSIIVPDEIKSSKSYQALWHKLKQGSYHIGEVKRITKTGKAVWFQGSFNPILDLNGKPYKIIEVIIDVTARKQAEYRILAAKEELQIKEANLTALINNTDDAIYTINKDYRVTLLNESAKRFYEDELGTSLRFGSNILDSLPRNYFYIWKGYYDRALVGEKFAIEQAIYSEQTNQKFYLSVFFNPILDDNGLVTGVSIFSRDITKRKQRELDFAEFAQKQNVRTNRIIEHQKQNLNIITEQYEAEKNQLEQLVSLRNQEISHLKKSFDFYGHFDCIAISFSHDYQVIQFNQQAKELFLKWHYYLQSDYYLPDIFPEFKFDKWKDLFHRALEGESFEITQVFPHHHLRKAFVFKIAFTPVKTESLEISHIIIIAKDITESIDAQRTKALKNKQKVIKLHKKAFKKIEFENKTDKDALHDYKLCHQYILGRKDDLIGLLDNHTDKFLFKIKPNYHVTVYSPSTKAVFFKWLLYLQPDYYLPDVFHISKYDQWIAYCDEAIAGRSLMVEEVFINRKMHCYFVFQIELIPLWNQNNQVSEVQILAKDITQNWKERRKITKANSRINSPLTPKGGI